MHNIKKMLKNTNNTCAEEGEIDRTVFQCKTKYRCGMNRAEKFQESLEIKCKQI